MLPLYNLEKNLFLLLYIYHEPFPFTVHANVIGLGVTLLQFYNILSDYFIDDLADSGETVKYIRNKFPNSYLCTLLMKDCCLSYPDFCVEDGLDGKQWVVFPWD